MAHPYTIGNNQLNWDGIFLEASKTSKSLCIQAVNPKPSAGSRNIFKDDEKEIMSAAKKYGFIICSIPDAKIISFVMKKYD